MSENKIILTGNGPVKGLLENSYLGYKYYSFQGIPYAKPPTGNLRFRDPQPSENWIEPLDATEQTRQSNNLVLMSGGPGGCEDSLHINIFTKTINPDKTIPVMVFIHGGTFMSGSSGTEMFGPDFLIDKNVILVTFNHRLGAFGYLSLNDPSLNVPGNAALKDQSLALKWIRKNISNFGGDSNNITLFGESAGGVGAHYQMISDMSKNLFDRAILQSGTALMHWAVYSTSDRAIRLAKKLGWTGKDNEKEILEFLRTVNPDEIVLAQEGLSTKEEIDQKTPWAFGPVVEPYISEQCFIPKHPKLMCREAWSNSIPLMIGGNSDEGILFYKEYTSDPTIIENTDFENFIPRELKVEKDRVKRKKFGDEIRKFYFGKKQPSLASIYDYCKLMTDSGFWHGIHRTVLSRVNSKNAGPTYLYRFSFDSSFSLVKSLVCGPGMKGACHGDEMSYLFSNFMKRQLAPETLEYKTLERMVGIWTKFATDGNPNPEIISPIKFEPVSVKKAPFKCLNISNELEVIELPETKSNSFWDSIFENSEQLF